MLNKAIKEGIVKGYKDIYSQTVEDKLKDISELPYFEGDFLPITLENEIYKLEGNMENDSCGPTKKTALSLMNKEKKISTKESKDTSLTTKLKKPKKKVKSPKSSFLPSVGDPLTDKILQFLLKFREVFLIIHLNHNLNISELPPIFDSDPWISSGIMSSREAYLEYCREKDNEFSSLRRAKYSSMVLLYELHKENIDIICCNHCKSNLITGLQCTVCKDFDLCIDCYSLIGHDHKMKHLRVNSESKSYYSNEEVIKHYLSHLNTLDHLPFCKNDNCTYAVCKNMKYLTEHFKICRKGRNNCLHCSLYFQLVFEHSKSCKNINCLILLCRQNQIAFLQTSVSKQFYNDSNTLPSDNHQESFAHNFIPNDEGKGFITLLNTDKLNQNNSVSHDQQYKTSVHSILGNSREVKSKSEKMNNCSTTINVVKAEIPSCQMQTFFTSNNETHSYLSEKANNLVQFVEKETNNENPFNNNNYSESVAVFELNKNGNNIYSKDIHMSSNLSLVLLDERNKKSSTSELVQNILPFNHKTELSNELPTNMENIDLFENFTIYDSGKNRKSKTHLNPSKLNVNSNVSVPFFNENVNNSVVPYTLQNIAAYSNAIDPKQQSLQEISDTQTVLSLINTPVYSKNMPQNIQASPSNSCSSQFNYCCIPFNQKHEQTSETSINKPLVKSTDYSGLIKRDTSLKSVVNSTKISSIPLHTSSFENSAPRRGTENLIVLDKSQVISTSKSLNKKIVKLSKVNKKKVHLRILPKNINRTLTSVFTASSSNHNSPQNLKSIKNLITNTSKLTALSLNHKQRKYFSRVSNKKQISDSTKLIRIQKKCNFVNSNKSVSNSSCSSTTSTKSDGSFKSFVISNKLKSKFVGTSKRIKYGKNKKYKKATKALFEPSSFNSTASKGYEKLFSETSKDVLSVNYCEISNHEKYNNPAICAATTFWTPDFQNNKLQISATSTVPLSKDFATSTASLQFSPSENSSNHQHMTVSEDNNKLFDFIKNDTRSNLVQTSEMFSFSNTVQGNGNGSNTSTGIDFSQTSCKFSTELHLGTSTNIYSQPLLHVQNGSTISGKIKNVRNGFPIFIKPIATSWCDNHGNKKTCMMNTTVGYSSLSAIHIQNKNDFNGNQDFPNSASYDCQLNSDIQNNYEKGFSSSLNEISFESINRSKEKQNFPKPTDYRNELTFPSSSSYNISCSDMFAAVNPNKQNNVNFDINDNFSTKSSHAMLSSYETKVPKMLPHNESFVVGNSSSLGLYSIQNDKSCSERQLSFEDLANIHKSDASLQKHPDALKNVSYQMIPIIRHEQKRCSRKKVFYRKLNVEKNTEKEK